MSHFYTLSEANSMLPELTDLIQKMQADGRQLAQLQGRALEMREKTQGNGNHNPGEDTAISQAISQAEHALRTSAQRLQEWELEMKDLQSGLVDFPALLDGRTVLLCWQLGEPQVGYWHEITTGFAGRRPVDDLFA